MKILDIVTTDDATLLRADDWDAGTAFEAFLKTRLGSPVNMDDWDPPRIGRYVDPRSDGVVEGPLTDVCALSIYLALTGKASGQFGPLLGGLGELLPIEVGDESLALVNVTNMADVLDEEKSVIWSMDDGSVVQVNRPVFRPDVPFIGDAFVVPQDPRRPYFTERFYEQLNLTGLRAVKVGEIPGW